MVKLHQLQKNTIGGAKIQVGERWGTLGGAFGNPVF